MTKPEVANGNQVPMAFHAKGNLKDVVRLLMVLQEEPHLAVDKTQIQIHPLYRKTTLNMDMTLAYTIVLPPHTEPNAIQSAQFSVEGRK
jgi:hypothetical protein